MACRTVRVESSLRERSGEGSRAGTLPAMTVRAAEMGDAAELAGLFAELGHPADAAAVAARIGRNTRPEYESWVYVTDDGTVAGFAGGHLLHPWENEAPAAQLMILVVGERYRGLGVGTTLVDAFEAWARREGAWRVLVTSRTAREAAHRFYVGRGYEQNGLRFGKRLA